MRRRLFWRSCCSRGMVLRMEPSGGARHYSRKGSSKAARACIFRKSGPATAEGVSGPGYVIVQALGISGFPRPAASSLWFIPQACMQVEEAMSAIDQVYTWPCTLPNMGRTRSIQPPRGPGPIHEGGRIEFGDVDLPRRAAQQILRVSARSWEEGAKDSRRNSKRCAWSRCRENRPRCPMPSTAQHTY